MPAPSLVRAWIVRDAMHVAFGFASALILTSAASTTGTGDGARKDEDREHASSRGGFLARYFADLKQGPGLWKWEHYFDIYEKHLSRFRGTDAVIVEVGIFSGGSLKMWRSYFGARATIIGVDIANATKVYERNPSYGSPDRIVVGDQASSTFWHDFKRKVPRVDVLLDDGAHLYMAQRTTLDAIFGHLAPGGVYMCEDLGAAAGGFESGSARLASYVLSKFVSGASGINQIRGKSVGAIQRRVAEVAFYPYVLTIEKRVSPLPRTTSSMHGTLWAPPSKAGEFGAGSPGKGFDLAIVLSWLMHEAAFLYEWIISWFVSRHVTDHLD